jgi:hypothetical protein
MQKAWLAEHCNKRPECLLQLAEWEWDLRVNGILRLATGWPGKERTKKHMTIISLLSGRLGFSPSLQGRGKWHPARTTQIRNTKQSWSLGEESGSHMPSERVSGQGLNQVGVTSYKGVARWEAPLSPCLHLRAWRLYTVTVLCSESLTIHPEYAPTLWPISGHSAYRILCREKNY